ncbi:MAG: DUF2721 domain-containing protein [Caulobacteraceae bacterium]
MEAQTLEAASHVVQLALTPVFLLSGVAALVNVFSTRLGRVSDQADKLAEQDKSHPDRPIKLKLLRWRSRALDCAVVLAALAGALTCGAALVLFLGSIRGSAGASLLFVLFGGAIVFTMAALACFVLEMILAAQGIRRLLDRSGEGDVDVDAPEDEAAGDHTSAG